MLGGGSAVLLCDVLGRWAFPSVPTGAARRVVEGSWACGGQVVGTQRTCDRHAADWSRRCLGRRCAGPLLAEQGRAAAKVYINGRGKTICRSTWLNGTARLGGQYCEGLRLHPSRNAQERTPAAFRAARLSAAQAASRCPRSRHSETHTHLHTRTRTHTHIQRTPAVEPLFLFLLLLLLHRQRERTRGAEERGFWLKPVLRP